MLFARWNALSRVEVDQVGSGKSIVIDADASTAIMNVDPQKWGETQPPVGGADHVGGGQPGYNWKEDLMSAAPAIANVLRPHGAYAIIGPGGGVDVLRAVANGSPSVTAIEINPLIANTIMRGRYADYSYHLYEFPQVHMHVADGRSWIRGSREKYDVVEMTLVDTWASTAAGAFALSENNLYTVEAFREYFDHLQPEGFIAITRWEFRRPREALRVVAQAIAALQAMGAKVQAYDPAGHEARQLLRDVDFKSGPYEAVEGADCVVIVTEWDEFRALDLERVMTLMRRPVVVDLRNVYRPEELRPRGFRYVSLGRA
jgi:hypothetical protein